MFLQLSPEVAHDPMVAVLRQRQGAVSAAQYWPALRPACTSRSICRSATERRLAAAVTCLRDPIGTGPKEAASLSLPAWCT